MFGKKEKMEKKFISTYNSGMANGTDILVDKETGVNYIFHRVGNAGGLTVRVDKDGKPIVTPVTEE